MLRRTFAAAVILFLVLLTAAAAADTSAWTGKWKMTSETDSGDAVSWTLELKADGEKMVAHLVSDDGEQPAGGVSFSDGVLKFKAPYQGVDYDIELHLKGDKLDGTWSGDGNSGHTSGTRM